MEITVNEIKMWMYYKARAKNFPKVPKRIQSLIDRSGRLTKPLEVTGGLDESSLRGFKSRLNSYFKDHLPMQLTKNGGEIEQFIDTGYDKKKKQQQSDTSSNSN